MIEIVGQQLRIRINDPKKYGLFRTVAVKNGKIDLIRGRKKGSWDWETQSVRLNLMKYGNEKESTEDYASLTQEFSIDPKLIYNGSKLLSRWWSQHRYR
jgi:hypothetical protein